MFECQLIRRIYRYGKMTIGSIFGSGTSPSPSTYYPLPGDTRQVLSERDGSGFAYGSSKRTKGKYKDKKHAAMSALTLLAFLFFLNILQNCLREQIAPIAPEVTMMMMLPAPQKNVKGEQPKEGDAPDGIVRRTRSLLQFEPGKKEPSRRTKFIHDVKDLKYWPKGLSQVSDKELEIHKAKTDNLRSFFRTVDDEEDWVPKVGPVPGLANQTEKSSGGKEDAGVPPVGTERNSYATSTVGDFQAPALEYPYPYPYLKHPQNHRFKYNRNGYYRTGPKHSPNRRNWNYHIREKYYPVTVVERQEEEEEDFGFDIIKMAWKVLTGVAGPIARMVPALAKIGKDESQCYDLFVCEAHRIGKFMGPTAEIFASTFSTFLGWYLGEEKREILMEAVNSGREGRTCQEQILNCDQRAGGKSAITLFAQLLETKLN